MFRQRNKKYLSIHNAKLFFKSYEIFRIYFNSHMHNYFEQIINIIPFTKIMLPMLKLDTNYGFQELFLNYIILELLFPVFLNPYIKYISLSDIQIPEMFYLKT